MAPKIKWIWTVFSLNRIFNLLNAISKILHMFRVIYKNKTRKFFFWHNFVNYPWSEFSILKHGNSLINRDRILGILYWAQFWKYKLMTNIGEKRGKPQNWQNMKIRNFLLIRISALPWLFIQIAIVNTVLLI